jgi:ATP-dependent DNA ligase
LWLFDRFTCRIEVKRRKSDPFIICGFVINPNSRGELSSLVLGAYLDGILKYFGMVGTGLSSKELEITLKELQKIVSQSSPFAGSILPAAKNISWTKPLVVCDVEYLELTGDGSLRHPVFKRFRPDLKPAECIYRLEKDEHDGPNS